jgi:hypothetical protein
MNFQNILINDFCCKALINGETCNHWIDYEIYDILPYNLKIKYLDQFPKPIIIFKPNDENKIEVRCLANHKDNPAMCRCDCSASYTETIREMKEDMISS